MAVLPDGKPQVTLQCHLLTHHFLGAGSKVSPFLPFPALMAEKLCWEFSHRGAGPSLEDKGGESP